MTVLRGVARLDEVPCYTSQRKKPKNSMGSFSIAHWLVVIVVLLLIFGPKRLSEVGKGLGQGIRNFKKGLDGSEKPEEEEEAEGEPKRLKSASKKSRSADADEDGDEDEEPKQLKPAKKTANQKRAEREADAD